MQVEHFTSCTRLLFVSLLPPFNVALLPGPCPERWATTLNGIVGEVGGGGSLRNLPPSCTCRSRQY